MALDGRRSMGRVDFDCRVTRLEFRTALGHAPVPFLAVKCDTTSAQLRNTNQPTDLTAHLHRDSMSGRAEVAPRAAGGLGPPGPVRAVGAPRGRVVLAEDGRRWGARETRE